MATCPECDAEVIVDEDDFEEMELGDPWDCEACSSRLRVSSLDPLEFDGDDEDDDEDEEKEAADGETAEGTEEDSDDPDDEDEADDDKDWDE